MHIAPIESPETQGEDRVTPFVLGPALAMLRIPGPTCFSWKFSSWNLAPAPIHKLVMQVLHSGKTPFVEAALPSMPVCHTEAVSLQAAFTACCTDTCKSQCDSQVQVHAGTVTVICTVIAR